MKPFGLEKNLCVFHAKKSNQCASEHILKVMLRQINACKRKEKRSNEAKYLGLPIFRVVHRNKGKQHKRACGMSGRKAL